MKQSMIKFGKEWIILETFFKKNHLISAEPFMSRFYHALLSLQGNKEIFSKGIENLTKFNQNSIFVM